MYLNSVWNYYYFHFHWSVGVLASNLCQSLALKQAHMLALDVENKCFTLKYVKAQHLILSDVLNVQ